MKPENYFQEATKGMLQVDVAKELQATQGQISDWKRGRRPLSPRAIVWTAKRLGITAEEILKARDLEEHPDAKDWWKKHAFAAVVAALLVTNFVTPENAKAASTLTSTTVSTQNTVYYVKFLKR